MLCVYGCGKESNYILKNGKHCCSKRPAGCEVLKKINSEKTKEVYTANKRLPMSVAYQNLPQETKNKMNWAKGKSLTPDERIFTENSFYSNEMVKGRIVKENKLQYNCAKCGIDSWQGETIVLDLDHINGNNTDNRLSNLRFLCPNCHSQTDTYKGRNKNSGRLKVTDQELIDAYSRNKSIRSALIDVGLAAKGGNYERIKKLIAGLGESADPAGLKPAA